MKNALLLPVLIFLMLSSFSQTHHFVDSDFLELDLGSDSTICVDHNLLLDAGSGYDAYLWQDGSAEQTYWVTTAGTYWVVAWIGTTAYSDTINIYNWPEPDPYLGEDTTLCFGESLLIEPGVGFTSYLWQNGSNLPFCIVSQAGLYYVSVTDMNGCNGSDTIVIDFATNVVNLGSDTIICECGSFLLDAGEGFNSYLWQDGSTTQFYLVDGSLLGPGLFEFHCTAVDSNNCESADTISVYIQEHTDIVSYNYDKIKIYPNPNNGSFVLNLSDFPADIYYYSLLDARGRVVETEKFRKDKMQESILLDIKEFTGRYLPYEGFK